MDHQVKGLFAIILTFSLMLYLFAKDMEKVTLFNQSQAVVLPESFHLPASISANLHPEQETPSPRDPLSQGVSNTKASDTTEEDLACLMPDDLVQCLVDSRLASSCIMEVETRHLAALYTQEQLFPDRVKYESLNQINDVFTRGERIVEEEESDEIYFLKQRSALFCVTFRDQCQSPTESRTIRHGDEYFSKLLTVFSPSELTEYVVHRSREGSSLNCRPIYYGNPDPEEVFKELENQRELIGPTLKDHFEENWEVL